MDQAVSKLKTEMEGSKNPYVKVIGDLLLQVIATNPAAAEKIKSEGKTILGGLKAVEAYAKKNQHDGMGMVADSEAYDIVLKYFGIAGKLGSLPVVATASKDPVVTSQPKPQGRFDISLDDLL